jgi:hypothetical protein
VITYLPIATIAPAGRGLVVSGSAPVDGSSVSVDGSRDLSEMASSRSVGTVADCRQVGGNLFVRAFVHTAEAMAKVRAGVLGTIAVVASVAGAELMVERVALVDRPQALGKRAGRVFPLNIEKVRKMGPKRIEFGKTVSADGLPIPAAEQRAAEAPAITMLREHLRQPAAIGDREMLCFLLERAGR